MVRGLEPGDPQRIGPYRLVGQLGRGGMGRVFLGLSAGGRPVAVKLVQAELAQDPEFRIRFRREVAAACRVSGLFTALVVDADVDGPVPWLATAYVPGPSLAEAVAGRGPMPAPQALALAAGLAESLSAIHAAGVVHCDLKPSNVLLSQDGPRVIDFGISRAAETAVTQAGLVAGSPGYMSPEQALGREVGPPGDVFSLGAVLAFAATGQGPFGGGSAPEVAYRVVYGPADLGGLPGQLRPLVERCLAKDPSARPTADEFLAEVGASQPTAGWLPGPPALAGGGWLPRAPALAGGGWPPGAPARASGGWPPAAGPDALPPPSETEPGRRPRRRVPALATAWGGGAILAAAAVAGLVLSGGSRPPLATQDQRGAPTAGASVSPGTRVSATAGSRTSSPAPGAIPAADALPARGKSPSPSTSSSPSPSASPTRPASGSPAPSASPSPSTSPFPSDTGSPPTVFPFVSSSPGTPTPAPRTLAGCRRPVLVNQGCARS